MHVELTPLDPQRHRLRVIRDDASTESVEIETRSYLFHDLCHLAVEAEVGLGDGFFTAVAAGGPLAADRDAVGSASQDAWLAEHLAARLQSSWRRATTDEIRSTLVSVAPDRVDGETAVRIVERLRRLVGHWEATRHGETMRIEWP
jgi:hypothetical protein